MPSPKVTPERVARYYAELTEAYGSYSGDTRGWHFGVWEKDVRSHPEALLRSNELLLRGIPVTAETRILDVGCGIGGFAVWAAKRFGCRVTGITVCRPHLADARKHARAEGVGDKCRFLFMDMDALALDRESFDVVVNQETYCCARDKRRYPAAIHGVLRKGGVWSAGDFALREGRLTSYEPQLLAQMLQGFHLPSLARPSEALAYLERAGFVNCEARDLTPLVLPTAAMMMRTTYLSMKIHLAYPRKRLYSRNAVTEANHRGHCEGGMLYSAGLFTGTFLYVLYRAWKAE